MRSGYVNCPTMPDECGVCPVARRVSCGLCDGAAGTERELPRTPPRGPATGTGRAPRAAADTGRVTGCRCGLRWRGCLATMAECSPCPAVPSGPFKRLTSMIQASGGLVTDCAGAGFRLWCLVPYQALALAGHLQRLVPPRILHVEERSCLRNHVRVVTAYSPSTGALFTAEQARPAATARAAGRSSRPPAMITALIRCARRPGTGQQPQQESQLEARPRATAQWPDGRHWCLITFASDRRQ